MAFATRRQGSSLAPAGPVGIALLQQAKSLTTEAIQRRQIKLKKELKLIPLKQIALRNDSRTITKGFANRLLVMENKINHLERYHLSNHFRMEVSKAFSSD